MNTLNINDFVREICNIFPNASFVYKEMSEDLSQLLSPTDYGPFLQLLNTKTIQETLTSLFKGKPNISKIKKLTHNSEFKKILNSEINVALDCRPIKASHIDLFITFLQVVYHRMSTKFYGNFVLATMGELFTDDNEREYMLSCDWEPELIKIQSALCLQDLTISLSNTFDTMREEFGKVFLAVENEIKNEMIKDILDQFCKRCEEPDFRLFSIMHEAAITSIFSLEDNEMSLYKGRYILERYFPELGIEFETENAGSSQFSDADIRYLGFLLSDNTLRVKIRKAVCHPEPGHRQELIRSIIVVDLNLNHILDLEQIPEQSSYFCLIRLLRFYNQYEQKIIDSIMNEMRDLKLRSLLCEIYDLETINQLEKKIDGSGKILLEQFFLYNSREKAQLIELLKTLHQSPPAVSFNRLICFFLEKTPWRHIESGKIASFIQLSLTFSWSGRLLLK